MAITIVVEDGTGKPDATSLFSLADVDAWLAPRQPSWAVLDVERRKQNLIIGNDYIHITYGADLGGSQQFALQALDFPRVCCYVRGFLIPEGTVPAGDLLAAVSMAAFKAETTILIPDQDNSGRITSTSVTAGPVSTSDSFGGGGASQQPVFTDIDRWMSAYLDGSRAAGLFTIGLVLG